MYKRALAIQEKVLGLEHPQVGIVTAAKTKADLGQLKLTQLQYAAARSWSASPPPTPEMPSGTANSPLAWGAWPRSKRSKVRANKRSSNSGMHGTSFCGSRLSHLTTLSCQRTLPGSKVSLGHYLHGGEVPCQRGPTSAGIALSSVGQPRRDLGLGHGRPFVKASHHAKIFFVAARPPARHTHYDQGRARVSRQRQPANPRRKRTSFWQNLTRRTTLLSA